MAVTTHPEALARRAAEAYAAASGVRDHLIAIVLGSGWGRAGEGIGAKVGEIDAERIPGFEPASIAGHTASIASVAIGRSGEHALLIGARAHFYESRDAATVAHPIRMAACLGARICVLTSACGAITPWSPGTISMISDHINLTGASPLSGARFIDLTDLYSPALRALVRKEFPEMPEGVYAQFPGPQYETPAEVRMAQVCGADMVGMSTALEAIAAREAGMARL